MRALAPTLTAAAYPTDGTLQAGCQLIWLQGRNSWGTAQITVLNNNVMCQVGKPAPDNMSVEWQPEFSLITSTIVLDQIAAVRFRDETSGAHGTVRVVLFEQGDPTPSSFGPIFSAGIGGINVNWYHNAALVGNEPGLDFLDAASGGLTWTLADVAGTKVTTKPVLHVADADVSLAAAIALSKLAAGTQGGTLYNGALGVVTAGPVGASGEVWTSNGAGADPTWTAIPSTGLLTSIARGTFDLVSSAAQTNIVLALLPNLSTSSFWEVEIVGFYTNSSGAGRTLTLKTGFGAVPVTWGDTSGAIAATANPHPFYMRMVFFNEGSAAVQRMAGVVRIGSTTAPTTGAGSLSGTDTVTVTIEGTDAVNTAGGATFVVAAQHSASSASLELKGAYTVKVYA